MVNFSVKDVDADAVVRPLATVLENQSFAKERNNDELKKRVDKIKMTKERQQEEANKQN